MARALRGQCATGPAHGDGQPCWISQSPGLGPSLTGAQSLAAWVRCAVWSCCWAPGQPPTPVPSLQPACGSWIVPLAPWPHGPPLWPQGPGSAPPAPAPAQHSLSTQVCRAEEGLLQHCHKAAACVVAWSFQKPPAAGRGRTPVSPAGCGGGVREKVVREGGPLICMSVV